MVELNQFPFQFYYYVNQRDNAKDWKCQPNNWLPSQLEFHEIILGFFSLNIGTLISTFLACWVINGGWSMVYVDPKEYGYFWLAVQTPVVFIYQDYLTYWTHRISHWPWFYKKFHKLHHTYKQPTAFSVTAIHPSEFVFIQCIYISPIFLMPVHFGKMLFLHSLNEKCIFLPIHFFYKDAAIYFYIRPLFYINYHIR